MKLTVREAARLLSVPESDLYRLVDDGQIPFDLVGHRPLFNRAELLEWALSQGRPFSIELFLDEGRMVPLAVALARGGVHHVGGGDRATALRAIIACLPIPDAADRELLFDIMLAREGPTSTGLRRGTAIPHVRSPCVFPREPASLALCYFAASSPFEVAHGHPVTAVFATMTPTIRDHFQLLSRLSFALHDAGFAAAVERRADREEIVAEAVRVDASLMTSSGEARP